MLLRPAHAADSDARSQARGAADRPGPAHDAASAWVLLGGLDRTLVQAGMVCELLEARRRVDVIVAAGLTAVNAVLASTGAPHTFARNWEALRARRFLPSSALGSSRVFARRGWVDRLLDALADTVHSNTDRGRDRSACHVAIDDGFERLPTDTSDPHWRALLRQTLRYAAAPPPLLAAAIGEAAGMAADVIVLGAERTSQTHPDVEAAIRAAKHSGVAVEFVTSPGQRQVGVLQYLLPGSGAPERLHRDGRGAASRWLRARLADSSGNGDGHGVAADPPGASSAGFPSP